MSNKLAEAQENWRQKKKNAEVNMDVTGESGKSIIHCGRCGKPKNWYGLWGQEPPQLCECLPLENYRSGQFVDNTKGWQCPNCGRVFAPNVEECLNCRPSENQFSFNVVRNLVW